MLKTIYPLSDMTYKEGHKTKEAKKLSSLLFGVSQAFKPRFKDNMV